MNIIIAGDGEVGFYLAKLLVNDNHHITIVDPHKDLLQMLEAQMEVMTISGNSTSIEILKKAGVNKADLFISVLHDEQINIVTCILAKKLGAKRTICRINNIEYLLPNNKTHFKELGVDELVAPEMIAANEIVKLLSQSAVNEMIDFSGGKLTLYIIKLDKRTTILNQSLNDIAQKYPKLDFRCVAIHREGKTIIPKGDDVFKVDDLAYIVTRPQGIPKLMQLSGKENVDIKNVMIIGGGRVGRKTAREIEKKANVKLIEIDRERALKLTDSIPDTLIISGDARDVQLLEDEGIRSMDAFVSVTDNSETNVFSCLLAKKFGVHKVIPLIENVDYFDISQNIGIDTMINKKLITASYITRFTMGANLSTTKCLNTIDADVFEFVVPRNAPITKKPIKQTKFPEGSIIGGIIRNDNGYIAVGDLQIKENDKVVVFALPEAVHKVTKLFN